MTPVTGSTGTTGPTSDTQAATATVLLSAFKFKFWLIRGPARGWLPRLQNPRRNQYKPTSKPPSKPVQARKCFANRIIAQSEPECQKKNERNLTSYGGKQPENRTSCPDPPAVKMALRNRHGSSRFSLASPLPPAAHDAHHFCLKALPPPEGALCPFGTSWIWIPSRR